MEAWLQKSGLADVEAAVYRIEAQVNELERQTEDFWRQVGQEQAAINHCKQKLSQIETDLEEIRDQLCASHREDIRQLQARLDEVDSKGEQLILEKGANQERIAELGNEITQLRKQIRVPGLADQLIVMASKTQWRGEVAEEMLPRIGKGYVLIYHSPKEDCQVDEIHIDGETYPLIRQSPNEYEFTEIVEVYRHG